jgi:8-oxo-dGTP pyrophosphatase MutT (NUDIX family)
MDLLWRIILTVGYRLLRFWWLVRQPVSRGAFVAVWCNNTLLLIENSYRSGETIPSGGIARRESPRQAARRELEEEVGIAAAEEDLVFADEVVVSYEHKEDHAYIFELHLDQVPPLSPDGREVTRAEFCRADDLPHRPLAPHVRTYLARRSGPTELNRS